MKSTMILAACLLFVHACSAQTKFGVTADVSDASGIGLHNNLEKSNSDGYRVRRYDYNAVTLTPGIGVSARYDVNRHFFLTSGLRYQSDRHKFVSRDNTQTSTYNNGYSVIEETRYRYLEMPLTINVPFSQPEKHVRPYVGVGMAAVCMLSMNEINSETYYVDSKSFEDDPARYRLDNNSRFIGYKRFLFPIAVEIGVTTACGFQLALTTTATPNHLVSDTDAGCVTCNISSSVNETVRNESLSVTYYPHWQKVRKKS